MYIQVKYFFVKVMFTSMWQVYDWPDFFIAQGCCPIVSFYTLNAEMSKNMYRIFLLRLSSPPCLLKWLFAQTILKYLKIVKWMTNILFSYLQIHLSYTQWKKTRPADWNLFFDLLLYSKCWVTCDYDFVEILLNQGYILQDIGNLR